MSRLLLNLFSGRSRIRDSFRSFGPRVAACTLLLAGVISTTSCGFLSQGAAENDHSAQTLTLSGNFPQGVTHQPYNSVLTVSGGNSPYQFAIKAGSLPPGMTLNASTGSISGTPTNAGAYVFEVAVSDAQQSHHGAQNFGISVTSGVGGGIQVSVTPPSVNVPSGATQTFTAAVSGTNNTAVTWSASAGSITSNGVFTAPAEGTATNVYITATSTADSSRQGLATAIVEPANGQQLAITNGNPPDGRTGNAYDASFTAAGGTQPYSWSVTAGSVPPGLSLSPNNGDLAGMPSTAGTYSFTMRVSDAGGHNAQKSFAVNVGAGGNMDGPAELPQVTVSSSMADSPAPGTTIAVSAGGDLQSALNSAQCGDTVELQAGAGFVGTFTLPAKNCDSGHWIIVRTSAPDSALPSEGTRANPCYAGVKSLPGRPAFNCSKVQNVMARIEYNRSTDGPITIRNGANYYRLVGLEITRSAGLKGAPTLVSVEPDGVADHIVVDRSWLHGTVHDETQLGVSLIGTNHVAVVDSYFTDFHCNSSVGTCTDAHAVSGGLGDHQDGPFKIENNFLEASGEAVIFGGGPATVTPADIEIRHNHFFKPWQWMPGNPNFVGAADGHPFIVKNHMELKNAIRVLAEANLMENNWGGFSQTGYAILLSPKSQHSQHNGNVCPLCQVTDVTVRYTYITHAGGGIQLLTGMSGNGGDGGPALAGTRWSIHDVVMDDINTNYVGGGTLFEVVNGWPQNPLNTITINHITGFPDPKSHLFSVGNQITNPPMHGFVFTNNIVSTGRYPVWNSGGGKSSCAYADVPVTTIANCFTTYTFGNNALVSAPQAFGPPSWPTGNFFPTDANATGFIQYNNGVGGNYELQSNSPYKNAGTDGKDLGADILGLQAALSGVE